MSFEATLGYTVDFRWYDTVDGSERDAVKMRDAYNVPADGCLLTWQDQIPDSLGVRFIPHNTLVDAAGQVLRNGLHE